MENAAAIVPKVGLEPTRGGTSLRPERSASSNSATSAGADGSEYRLSEYRAGAPIKSRAAQATRIAQFVLQRIEADSTRIGFEFHLRGLDEPHQQRVASHALVTARPFGADF